MANVVGSHNTGGTDQLSFNWCFVWVILAVCIFFKTTGITILFSPQIHSVFNHSDQVLSQAYIWNLESVYICRLLGALSHVYFNLTKVRGQK